MDLEPLRRVFYKAVVKIARNKINVFHSAMNEKVSEFSKLKRMGLMPDCLRLDIACFLSRVLEEISVNQMEIAFNECLHENEEDFTDFIFGGTLSFFRRNIFMELFNKEMHTRNSRVLIADEVFSDLVGNISPDLLKTQKGLLNRNILEKSEENKDESSSFSPARQASA